MSTLTQFRSALKGIVPYEGAVDSLDLGSYGVYADGGYYGGSSASPTTAIFPYGLDMQTSDITSLRYIQGPTNDNGFDLNTTGVIKALSLLDMDGASIHNLSILYALYGGGFSIYLSNAQLVDNAGSSVALDWQYRQLQRFQYSNPQTCLDWSVGYANVNLPLINGTASLTFDGVTKFEIAYDGTDVDLNNYTGDINLNTPIVMWGDINANSSSIYDMLYASADDGRFDYLTNKAYNGPPSAVYGVNLQPTGAAALIGAEGTIAYVNDATSPTIGATVAGGGSAKCLVCYNGTNWKVTSLL